MNTPDARVSDRPVTTPGQLAAVVVLAAKDMAIAKAHTALTNANNALNAGMDRLQSPEVQARLDEVREMAALAVGIPVATAVALGSLPFVVAEVANSRRSSPRPPTWDELNLDGAA